MIPAYVTKLGLTTQKTSVGAQKIDGLSLETYGIVSASFLLKDSQRRVRFFEETFLLVDTSFEVVLGMLFLAFSNADFQFGAEELIWKTYTIAKALPITCQIKLIDKREFGKAALDKKLETFVVHISAVEVAESSIHPFRAAQIATL